MSTTKRRLRAGRESVRQTHVPATPQPVRSRGTLIIGLLLVLTTLCIYIQTARYGYIAYDDDQYVYANRYVKGGLSLAHIGWAFTTFFYANWHPLTWISYLADFSLFGSNPGVQHVENMALHSASALLLFLTLSRATLRPWRAALVAAVFAVHPLHVESVAWISERKDVLCTFFEMLGLFLYVCYVGSPSRKRYLAVAAAFACSLLAKPMAVTFPLVLLLVDFWPLHRIARPLCGRTIRRLLLEKVPLLALSTVAAVLTFLAQQRFGAVIAYSRLSLGARAANATIAYVGYIGKFFWPSNLAVLYPPRTAEVSLAVLASLLLAVITAAVVIGAWKWPYLLVGWFWYLGMLVPVIGLVQVGIQSSADRYTYLPTVGLSILVVWTIAALVEGHHRLRLIGVAAATAAVGLLAVAAFRQVSFWKTSRMLFEHTLAVTQNNYVIQNNLGVIVAQEGDSSQAVALYRAALASSPDYAEARANLAHEFLKSGQLAQAEVELAKALALRPNLASALEDWGVLLAARGRFEEARQYLVRSLAIASEDADYESNLCYVLTHLGRPDEAIVHCNSALRINPELRAAQFNLEKAKEALVNSR